MRPCFSISNANKNNKNLAFYAKGLLLGVCFVHKMKSRMVDRLAHGPFYGSLCTL